MKSEVLEPCGKMTGVSMLLWDFLIDTPHINMSFYVSISMLKVKEVTMKGLYLSCRW